VPAAKVVATVNFCRHEQDQLVKSIPPRNNGDETHFREQHFHNACCGDGSNDLSKDDHSGACVSQAADQCQSQGHSWVEQPTANAEEDPCAYSETEAEGQRDV
jgi:hypothetical protein